MVPLANLFYQSQIWDTLTFHSLLLEPFATSSHLFSISPNSLPRLRNYTLFLFSLCHSLSSI